MSLVATQRARRHSPVQLRASRDSQNMKWEKIRGRVGKGSSPPLAARRPASGPPASTPEEEERQSYEHCMVCVCVIGTHMTQTHFPFQNGILFHHLNLQLTLIIFDITTHKTGKSIKFAFTTQTDRQTDTVGQTIFFFFFFCMRDSFGICTTYPWNA